MDYRALFVRLAALVTFTFWVGGFTFYSAVVIPVLHDALGSSQAGFITQEVTNGLNLWGLAALVAWWFLVALERNAGTRGCRGLRLVLLAATSLILLLLFVLHRIMDEKLGTSGLNGFYSWHRVYLILSTVQWVINLALLGTSLIVWGSRAHPEPSLPRTDLFV